MLLSSILYHIERRENYDIDSAIDVQLEAVASAPPDNPNRAIYSNNFGKFITSPIYRTRLITHGTLWGLVAGAIAGKRRIRYPGSFPILYFFCASADHLFVRCAYPASLYTTNIYSESTFRVRVKVLLEFRLRRFYIYIFGSIFV